MTGGIIMFMTMSEEEKTHFKSICEKVINEEEYQKRKTFEHHINKSVYEHCIRVAIISYIISKKLNLDVESTVIGALLHDFYTKPWQTDPEKYSFLEQHGFRHAREACENSMELYKELITPLIQDIIKKHMFPLNITPPSYPESWVVSVADKIESLEILTHPTEWPKYLGVGHIDTNKKLLERKR